jgi:membrane protease YdiL (CAAX protease family)
VAAFTSQVDWPTNSLLIHLPTVGSDGVTKSPSELRQASDEVSIRELRTNPRPQMLSRLFLDDSGRLRTVWRFAIFGAGFVGITFGVNIAVGIGYAIYLLSATRTLNPEQLAEQIHVHTPQLAAIIALPLTVVLTGLAIACRRFLDRQPVASMGLVVPDRRSIRSLIAAFMLGMAPILLATLVLWGSGEFKFGGLQGTVMTAMMVPTLILMAFDEEIVCRGYLFQNMIDVGRPVSGAIITSLAFWLAHALNPDAWGSPWIGVNLFLAGVLFAVAYLAMRSLWFVTVMHFSWNFTQGVVFDIPVSGIDTPGLIEVTRAGVLPEWITGGKFGLEGSVLITGCEVLMVIGFILFIAFRPQVARGSTADITEATESVQLAELLED